MIPLQAVLLVLMGIVGTTVVLARDPLRQAIVNSVYGITEITSSSISARRPKHSPPTA